MTKLPTPSKATEPVDVSSLDFATFVSFAGERAAELEPGLDVEAMRFVLALHRAASTVVYDIESTVHRPRGWSWSGFRLIYVLWISGPLEAKTAARLSGNSRQASSILANRLEQSGLLERRPDPADGRTVQFALTPAGTEAIATVIEEHNRRETLWASVLTEEERSAVTRILGKLLAATSRLDIRHRDA